MKRYCLTIILLFCLHCMARGQTTYGYSYWFDGNLASRQQATASLPTSPTGAPEPASLHIDADVSGLAEGFHTLHVAVDDGQGTVVRVENAYFLKSQTEQLLLRSYIDGLLHSEQAVAAGSGGLRNVSVDVSNVSTGLHQLHLMATTQGGTPVATYTTDFVRMATAAEQGSLTARCYVDGLLKNVTALSVGSGTQTLDLDLGETSPGIHRLDVTLQTEGSAPVAAFSRFFIRNATADELSGLVCTTYVDGVPYSTQTIDTGSGTQHLDLDVSRLPKGLHHLHLTARTPNGRTTSIYSAFFMRTATAAELGDMRLYYKFDTGQHGVLQAEATEAGYHFAPDVSQLPAGLHHATFMFADGSNTHGETRNVFFVKESQTAASHYQYWVNGDTANIQTMPIQQWSEPTQITAMLTVPAYPLRPSRYHFEVEQGVPYAYALNDLSMRFYNEHQASVDTTASYVDVTTGGQLTDVVRLTPDTAYVRTVPPADSIRWFSLTLNQDSPIELKTSTPATIELYSPAGDRLHQVSGTASTDFTGPADPQPAGTYWVGVHTADSIATDTNGDTLHIADIALTAHYELAYEPAPTLYDRFTVEGIAYRATSQSDADGWAASVTTGGAYSGELTVPASVVYDSHTWQVTGVDAEAFADYTSLYSVSLPQSIAKVGRAIFSGAERLAAIQWPMDLPMVDSIMAGVSENPNMLIYVNNPDVAATLPEWAQNIVVNGVADRITLSDGLPPNDFYCPVPFTATYISYTHNYSQTSGLGSAHGWESIALPFDVQDITHETRGSLTPMKLYQPDGATVQYPFWLAALGDEGFYEVGAVSANTPYIICMPNNEAYSQLYNVPGNVTFSASDAEVHAASEGYQAGVWGELLLTPNFQRQPNGQDFYALNATTLYLPGGGDGDAFVRNHREVLPFEAYIQATGGSGARERIPIDLNVMANAIVMVQADGQGLWSVYDLTGRMLRQTDNRLRALQGLPAGVYIVNGQKILLK